MQTLIRALFGFFLALLVVFMLAGCKNAGTSFRRDVESVSLTGQGGTSPDGTVTAGAGATFTFRDPDRSK